MLMCERGLVLSREKARGLIMAGDVSVDGRMVDKPGSRVPIDAELSIRSKPRFVSRGGEKLAAALDHFALKVEGLLCADVGASTGGFTDCLLQHHAARVYAIDVGYGQLDYRLRQDSRVVVMERTNARHVQCLPEAINLAVIDASFISLRLLLPSVTGWLAPMADIVALIKPQFEAGRRDVGRGGVVRSPDIHTRVIQDILAFATDRGLGVSGLMRSPIKGPAGNIEFLAWLSHGLARSEETSDHASRIAEVVLNL